MNKIYPCLWFHTKDGTIAEVVEYYQAIFQDNLKTGRIIPLGETPSGHTEMCDVHIFDQKYTFMSTEEAHHPLNDSVSFVINCEDQAEIDRYWNAFTKEGEESQCGWCIDRYGLRWQVMPQNMAELMSRPNAWQVLMNQKKIVIAEY